MAIGPDVVDVLVDDHRQIDGLLEEVTTGGPVTGEDDQRLISVCIAELARHLVVEEEYLYPLAAQVLPAGERLASDGVTLAREAERAMKRLEGAAPIPDRQPLVDELRGILRRHVQETEAELFPELRRRCDPAQLGHLAGVVELAKSTAPTRPHPGAPHTTPWNQILSPGVGLVDRIRDAVTGRPTKPER